MFDVFAATSGAFAASSSASCPLTFGISGELAGTPALDGGTYDVSKAGPYGTLYRQQHERRSSSFRNSGRDQCADDADHRRASLITVSDGTLSANQTFTININGANDAAIISGTAMAAVIEAARRRQCDCRPLARPASSPTPTSTTRPTPSRRSARRPKARGGYGTFTMTAAGVWTYTLDDANSTVQALNVGDKLTDSFTVTTIDGTATGGDDHHRRHQRRGRHFRRHRTGGRGRRQPHPARQPRPARSPIPTSTIRPTRSRRSARRRPAMAATAPSR